MPLLQLPIAQEIVFQLKKSTHQEVAMTQKKLENVVYYTTSPETDKTRPFNCIVNLMQWLNEKNVDQSGTKPADSGNRKIYTSLKEIDSMTTAMASMNEFEIVKVNNKTANKVDDAAEITQTPFASTTWESRADLTAFAVDAHTWPQVLLTSTASSQDWINVHRLYMMAAFSLIVKGTQAQNSNDFGSVAAILADASGEILAWSRNTRGVNSTRHAEVNLIQSLFANAPNNYKTKLNRAVLYTTLKPCKMCAAMIDFAGKGKIEVYYGQDDKGDDAKQTALDKPPQKNWLLGARNGEKPIFLEKGAKNLSGALFDFREVHKLTPEGKKGIVTTLGQQEAINFMTTAQGRLNTKIVKYANAGSFAIKYPDGNPDKEKKYALLKKVADHLSAFLQSV